MVRILGGLLMALGAVVVLAWFIKPLRQVLPLIYDGFRSLPGAIQFGLVVAAIGFLLLISSLIWERLEDRKREGRLLDDDN
jgi:drug/metabolite transporter superfamily protein YnfA